MSCDRVTIRIPPDGGIGEGEKIIVRVSCLPGIITQCRRLVKETLREYRLPIPRECISRADRSNVLCVTAKQATGIREQCEKIEAEAAKQAEVTLSLTRDELFYILAGLHQVVRLEDSKSCEILCKIEDLHTKAGRCLK